MDNAFVLPRELTICDVGTWHGRLLGWVADGDGADLKVDASPLADIDAAGVQLLTSLANALEQRGRRLVLESAGDALAQVCTRLGAAFLLTDRPATGTHP